MILISHRGNTTGKQINLENNPDYVDKTIRMGYNVEVNLWLKEDSFFLGHDEPQYKINMDWLTSRKNKLWIHCKNLNSFDFLSTYGDNTYKFFWHQKDNYTLTSNLMIWAYPDQPLSNRSIAVMPENTEYTLDQLKHCAGVCSDFIANYRILR
jgi:hypothetical protein